jgi:hypothetical protein
MKRALLPLTIIASLLAPASAFAIDRIGWSDTRETMYIHGRIEIGDAEIIADAIKTSRRLRGIILNSPGGNPYEGAKLTELVMGYSFDTGVTKGGMCNSACFMLWAAGKNKYVYPDSMVGIHSASQKSADNSNISQETQFSMVTTMLMARAYGMLNVPYYLIGVMVTTPSNDIYKLTPQDLANMHVQYMQ